MAPRSMLLLAALLGLATVLSSAADKARPNVLFFAVDDVRPEAHDVSVDVIVTSSGIRWISDATAPEGASDSTR